MGRFLLVVAAFALHLYVLLDVLRSPGSEVRVMPKGLWLVVSLVPVVGPVGWLLAGRPAVGPSSEGGGPGGLTGGPRPGRGPIAPDDDPEFLKRLDEQSWAARMEKLRRERATGGRGAVTPPPSDEPPPGNREGDEPGSPEDPVEGRGSQAGEPPTDRLG